VKFNFSHNGGTPQQPVDFPDLEAFAENNYSIELEDLTRMIDLVSQENSFNTDVKKGAIHLIGHSRGGGIVLIKAEEDTRISKVATWAGVCDYKIRFKEDTLEFKNFRKTGTFYVENARTKQQMPHHWQFYTNFIANEKRLTIQRAASNLKIPYLILHGDADATVPIEEAKVLHSACATSILTIIASANHVFGANHPWQKETLPNHLKEAVKATQEFFN
jgi:alpha-beta hydrolase superfamily lysophospholipase